MNFTIQSALVPVEQGYETVDVQLVDGRIAAIAPIHSSSHKFQTGSDRRNALKKSERSKNPVPLNA